MIRKTIEILMLIVLASHHAFAFFPNCEFTVVRYFQCKHLKMVPNKSMVGGYQPDPSLLNNKLNASFLDQTLGNLTMEEAFDLQWTIFNSTRNCSSEFCKCVGLTDKITHPGYKSLFENRDIFDQFKQVIKSYEKLSSLNPGFFSQHRGSSRQRRDFSSICGSKNLFFNIMDAQFLFKVQPKCLQILDFEINYQKCIFSQANRGSFTLIINRLYSKSNSKRDEIEKQSICVLRTINFSTCSAHEIRFSVMALMPIHVNNVWSGVTNLSSYIDYLVEQAAQVNDAPFEQYASLYKPSSVLDSRFDFVSINQTRSSYDFSKQPNVNLFNSRQWKITANLINQQLRFTISLSYDPLISDNKFNRTFDFDSNFIHDCSIRDPIDPSNKIWIRIISFSRKYSGSSQHVVEVFDLKWNVYLKVTQSSLDLFISNKFAINSTGLLVQGRDEHTHILEEKFKSKTRTTKKPTTTYSETTLKQSSSTSTTTSNKDRLENDVGKVDQKDDDESDESELEQVKNEFEDVYQNAEFPNFPDLDREDDELDFDSER